MYGDVGGTHDHGHDDFCIVSCVISWTQYSSIRNCWEKLLFHKIVILKLPPMLSTVILLNCTDGGGSVYIYMHSYN